VHQLVNKDFDSIKIHSTTVEKSDRTYFIQVHLSVLLHKFKCSFNSRTWNTLDIITYSQGTQGLKCIGDLPQAGISLYLITVQFTDCVW
jgi:hypothetical protein